MFYSMYSFTSVGGKELCWEVMLLLCRKWKPALSTLSNMPWLISDCWRSLFNWNSLLNAGCLWWWLCWCEHFASLGQKNIRMAKHKGLTYVINSVVPDLWQQPMSFTRKRWMMADHQLRALHCNTQNFETTNKKFGSIRRFFWNTTLGLAPCKPLWKQVRRWISPSHQTYHTVQIWHHATFTFIPKIKEDLSGYLHNPNKELERTVRTWMKKQSVEFFCDSFEKLVQHWQRFGNGGDYVER